MTPSQQKIAEAYDRGVSDHKAGKLKHNVPYAPGLTKARTRWTEGWQSEEDKKSS